MVLIAPWKALYWVSRNQCLFPRDISYGKLSRLLGNKRILETQACLKAPLSPQHPCLKSSRNLITFQVLMRRNMRRGLHLLKNNYVEDDENMFRFNYSKEFLRWALRIPGYYRNWHIGVRAKTSKKLVPFIIAVLVRIRVCDEVVKMVENNFLRVHRKFRAKRLAPVMINEVARRVHLANIWQAAYTAGVVIDIDR